MSKVEAELKDVLAGKPVPLSLIQEPNGSFMPLVKKTVTYIVTGLVFRDDGKFVLIQEEKPSCHGTWYLPAGRVEPGENLVDAVKREVLEEAGLQYEPTSLVSVEERGFYYRFTYVGQAVGGHLKTLAEKDEESLQADWFTVDDLKHGALKIRAKDMFKILKIGAEYLQRQKDDRHPLLAVIVQPHRHIVLRPVIVRETEDGLLEVLTCKGSLISCPIDIKGLLPALQSIFKVCFRKQNLNPSIQGILSLEHCGIPSREHDGICITNLVYFKQDSFQATQNLIKPDYIWERISDTSLFKELKFRLEEHHTCALLC